MPQLPAGWPKNRPLAISVNIMCEAWTDDAAPGIGPMGNPLKSGHLDSQARSWAEYGMTTGAYRLLNIVQEAGVPCGCYASGIIAEKWPQLLDRINTDGHFIGAHAWAQNCLPIYQDREAEAEDIQRGIDRFVSVTGKRPLGFISPRATPSPNTFDLLAGMGFRWTLDVFDHDLPYLIQTPSGPLAGVPFTMEVNDLPLYMRHGNPPEIYTTTLKRILEGYESIGSPPALLDITAHAHVFGRPFGAIEFKAAINLVKDLDWVWMTSHNQVANLVYPR